MTRCYWSDSKGEWWNSKTGYTSLLPCTVALNNRLQQHCVVLYKTSLLAHAHHSTADIFSVCRDLVLQAHLPWMCIIPTKVNENCACNQERQDPFVYNKRVFFHVCIITWIESLLSSVSFPQRYLVFPPLSQTLNKHMGEKIPMLLWKELNGLPKSRLLLWKQCWINYHSQTEKQRMAGERRGEEKNTSIKKCIPQNATYIPAMTSHFSFWAAEFIC